MSSLQYTIRSIPKELDAELRAEAHRSHMSLNEVVIANLKKAKGIKEKSHDNKDFDKFFGVWTKKEADVFDSEHKAMRKANLKDWQ